MSEKIFISGAIILAGLVGFLAGKVSSSALSASTIPQEKISPEVSVMKLEKIEGDILKVETSGAVKILWGEKNFLEGEGDHDIPLGQIPNEKDIAFSSFPYLGNTKTKKFYPTDSYPARGTEVRYRRFFQTKQEAIDAGFIPMKNMK